MCAKLGKKSGIVATAHKLARIVYALLTKGQAYVDVGQTAFEESPKKRTLKSFERRSKELGFTLVPPPGRSNRSQKEAFLKEESFCQTPKRGGASCGEGKKAQKRPFPSHFSVKLSLTVSRGRNRPVLPG